MHDDTKTCCMGWARMYLLVEGFESNRAPGFRLVPNDVDGRFGSGKLAHIYASTHPSRTSFSRSVDTSNLNHKHGRATLAQLSPSRIRQSDSASVGDLAASMANDSFLDPLCPFSAKITRSLAANVIPLVKSGGKYESHLQVIPWMYAQPL